MIGPEAERPHPDGREGWTDSVTFAFGDAAATAYGSARIGLSGQPAQASALALLFHAGAPVGARAQGGLDAGDRAWEEVEAAGIAAQVLEPLRRWRVRFEGDDAGFDLEFTAVSAPAELGPGDAAASAAGLAGYEQVCRVEGEVRAGPVRVEVGCLGQRGHSWGAVDWERIELARTVSAWLEDGRAVTVAAVRPRAAGDHGAEALSAFVYEAPAAGEPAAPSPVAEPRLSTTYDAEGRHVRSGAELWMGREDEMPRRLAGVATCGTSLDLGRLRLDSAFFQWRMEGVGGVWRYDVLRRA